MSATYYIAGALCHKRKSHVHNTLYRGTRHAISLLSMTPNSRPGFSLPELVIVITIIGVTVALAAPKITSFQNQNDLNAAAATINSYMYRARAAAIGQAKTVRVATSGNTIWVIVPSTGDTVASRQNLLTDRKVTMTATVANIDFTPRGFASGLSAADPPRFTLTRGGATKVICTTYLGMVRPSC